LKALGDASSRRLWGMEAADGDDVALDSCGLGP
jgi:hypothetical protein